MSVSSSANPFFNLLKKTPAVSPATRSPVELPSPSSKGVLLQETIGFSTLPDQIHRKTLKKGFEFTVMVVGEHGLGKSTFINTLFMTELYADRPALARRRTSMTVFFIRRSSLSSSSAEDRGDRESNRGVRRERSETTFDCRRYAWLWRCDELFGMVSGERED